MVRMIITPLFVFEIFVDFAIAVVILAVAKLLRQSLRTTIAPRKRRRIDLFARLATLAHARRRRNDAVARHPGLLGIARTRRSLGKATLATFIYLAQISLGATTPNSD